MFSSPYETGRKEVGHGAEHGSGHFEGEVGEGFRGGDFAADTHPDRDDPRSRHLFRRFGFLAMSVASLWLTVLAGAWVASGVEAKSAALHGLLVGFVVAAVGPAFGILGPSSVTLAALVVLAGWAGGILDGNA